MPVPAEAARAADAQLDAWERDAALTRPAGLPRRLHYADRLERIELIAAGTDATGSDRRDRLQRLRAQWEDANRRDIDALRQAIRQGHGSEPLRNLLADTHIGTEAGTDAEHDDSEGYDWKDTLLAEVLALSEPDAEIAALAPGLVRYQPTPARHLFAFLQRAALSADDVLIDLGSGLGQVPLVAALLTPAHCIGIELESAYVDTARRSAEALALRNVEFIRQDARLADLEAGTVFYLYTPFVGAPLASMLERLREQARHHPLRLCTLGPCTPIVAAETWLRTSDSPRRDRPVLFHGR